MADGDKLLAAICIITACICLHLPCEKGDMHCRHCKTMQACQETSDQGRLQDLAPATPSHSQQEDSSLALPSDGEVTSGNVFRAGIQQHSGGLVQADLCRADMSGAALLISQELATADPLETAVRTVDKGDEPLDKEHQASTGGKRRYSKKGNYHGYYSYRLAQGEVEDPRLQVNPAAIYLSLGLGHSLQDGALSICIACSLSSQQPPCIRNAAKTLPSLTLKPHKLPMALAPEDVLVGMQVGILHACVLCPARGSSRWWQVMEKRWFVNKRCMDIGCNEGALTLEIAARFQSASMLGIDIDQQLIKRACL